MMIVLVGAVPEYKIDQGDFSITNHQELIQHVTFTEDVDSIVTEVRGSALMENHYLPAHCVHPYSILRNPLLATDYRGEDKCFLTCPPFPGFKLMTPMYDCIIIHTYCTIGRVYHPG